MNSNIIRRNIRDLSKIELIVLDGSIHLNNKEVNNIKKEYFESFSNNIKKIIEDDTSGTVNHSILNEFKNSLREAKTETLNKWDEILERNKKVILLFDFNSDTPLEILPLDFLVDEEQVERKETIFDGVIEFLKLDADKKGDLDSHLKSLDIMQSYVPNKDGSSGEIKPDIRLNRVYSIGQLYYVFMIKIAVIEDLIKHLEALDNPNEENLNNNTYGLVVNLMKKDVAIFFHTLYELKLLRTDVNGNYDSQLNLKQWIDSNIFYRSNSGKNEKVIDINKSFSPLNKQELDDEEIKFLKKILIPKINERLKVLNDPTRKANRGK